MRKIEIKEDKEKKESRNKLIIGIILVGIMVVSTAGYAFFSTEKSSIKKIDYRGVKFILQDDGLWHTEIQSYDFSFVFNPKDTENISISMNFTINDYASKPLYFSSDSNRQATEEIVRNIARFSSRTQYVCLDECEENLPVKNCSENVIAVKEINESLIKQEDKCIYILANQEEILKAGDAFIFRLLGIQ